MADVKFTSNKAKVLAHWNNKVKPAILSALGMEFTHHSMNELDVLIYNTPPTANYRRTGRLRAGQGYQVDLPNDLVIVFNSTSYAVHVHFAGITRNWDGRPWMTNTINSKQRELQAVVEHVIQQFF